jgi:hypothetical protein
VKCKKCKVLSITGSGGPYSCEMSRLPHFLDNRLTQMVVRLSALRACPILLSRRFPVLISIKGLAGSRALVAAGKLRWIEKSNILVGNRTCDLPAFSIISQPTTLPYDLIMCESGKETMLIFSIPVRRSWMVSDKPGKCASDQRSTDIQAVVDFFACTRENVLSDCRYRSINSLSQMT